MLQKGDKVRWRGSDAIVQDVQMHSTLIKLSDDTLLARPTSEMTPLSNALPKRLSPYVYPGLPRK